MQIYEHIGEALRRLRSEHRISQETLAGALKVSTNTVSRWETATYKLTLHDLQKVANYFKVPLSSLLPPEETDDISQKALLSATGDLPQEEIEELITYAQYRRARRLLEGNKK